MSRFLKEGDVRVPGLRRRLRAVLAIDIANFSGRASVTETISLLRTTDFLTSITTSIESAHGKVICEPGDGVVALFESAVESVRCALEVQSLLADAARGGEIRARIGIHLGDVLFDGEKPFGETISIAARLEGLADAGGILVSSAVFDAVSARILARFEERGSPVLKNIPRRIETFNISALDSRERPGSVGVPLMDRTTRFFAQRSDSAIGNDGNRKEASSPKIGDTTLNNGMRLRPRSVRIVNNQIVKGAGDELAESHVRPDAVFDGLITDEVLNIVTAELIVFLGPIGKLLVKQSLVGANSVPDLVSALRSFLGGSGEREKFDYAVQRRLNGLKPQPD